MSEEVKWIVRREWERIPNLETADLRGNELKEYRKSQDNWKKEDAEMEVVSREVGLHKMLDIASKWDIRPEHEDFGKMTWYRNHVVKLIERTVKENELVNDNGTLTVIEDVVVHEISNLVTRHE